MGLKLDKNDSDQVKRALAILEPIAQKNECAVSDLVASNDGAEPEVEEEGDDGKVNLIVARMKAGSEDKKYEG